MSEKKINIQYHLLPSFSKRKEYMEELHIWLTPNKEHKEGIMKVFSSVPVIGFWNGKSLKDYSFRTKLLKLEESGIWEPCGKIFCLFCDSISTNTTLTIKAYQETFKIQKGPLNFDSENVPYLFKCKVCDDVAHIGKVNIEHSERLTKTFFRKVFTLTIA